MQRHTIVAVAFIVLLVASGATVPVRNAENTGQTRSDDMSAIIQMTQQINESMLYAYHHGLMAYGIRYTGTLNCNLAAQYLYDSFKDMGLPVEFQDWHFGKFTSQNVVATLNGTDKNSTAEYILCGHYDTVEAGPGADDDGSGTAAVLAIASVLSQHTFNHTIKFITFSGEEVGTYGSYSYAREANERDENIVAVLNMDMIGYANTVEGGRILRFFPPTRSRWIADEASAISQEYNAVLNITVDTLPAYRGDDSQAFVDYGYDGVWIAHQDGYPYGHSANDTADHLNWTYYVKATKLMLAITAEFAQRPIPVQVILQAPEEGHLYVFARSRLSTALPKQWFSGLRGITIIIGRGATASATVISKDPIQYVVFCIDGYFISWDSEPPYEWKITGLYTMLFGRHTLNVFAYTTTGQVAYDEMDITFLMLTYQH
jgi:hypothetical protein